ncbi:MAG: Por secretion system C-terminal sorting protein [Chlorobi bacterium]|nr:Por secretion system C-terminal sorting protein [Chlorobiota bacterium]
MRSLGLFSTKSSRTGARLLKGILIPVLVAGPLMAGEAVAQGIVYRGGNATVARNGAANDPGRSTVVSPGTAHRQSKSGGVPVHRSLQADPAQYRVMDSLINAFSYYTGDQEPLVYDAASGILATIKRGSVDAASDKLFLRTSTDMGMTWSAPVQLYDGAQGNARYPSLVILKSATSDPKEVSYFFTAPMVEGDQFGKFVSGLVDPQKNVLATVVTDGVNGETWSTGSRNLLTNDNKMLMTVGELSGNNIGVRIFDLESATITKKIPTQWDGTHFSDPGTPTSRTAVSVGIGQDNADAIYYGILSRFPSADDLPSGIQPYLAVSRSTDKGATWSDFDVIPRKVMEDYASANGMVPANVRFFYNEAQDFAVTGTNSYSFLADLNDYDGTTVNASHLVEAYHDNDGWHMRKVSDITGSTLKVIADETDTTGASQMGNEVQLARTADGSKLIAKWTDLVSYVFNGDIDADGVSPDTLTTTDVFMSARSLAKDTWSPSLNVTNSPIFDRVTWIPRTLPNDLSNIPLLTLQRDMADTTYETPNDSLFLDQRDVFRSQWVTMSNVNISQLAGVAEPVVTSRSGMKLESVYPNPAVGQATIRFTTTASADVSVGLWNVLGEQVMTLGGGRMEPGNHSVTFNSTLLPAGTYYYTLRSNGETLTRAFTVIR